MHLLSLNGISELRLRSPISARPCLFPMVKICKSISLGSKEAFQATASKRPYLHLEIYTNCLHATFGSDTDGVAWQPVAQATQPYKSRTDGVQRPFQASQQAKYVRTILYVASATLVASRSSPSPFLFVGHHVGSGKDPASAACPTGL